jgi:hypothetical protein
MMERLAPQLERLLGSVVRLIEHGKFAEGLEPSYKQFLERIKSKEVLENIDRENVKLGIFAEWAMSDFCHRNLLSMVDESKEFEIIYSELEKSGMLERLRTADENLLIRLQWLHGCTETFSQKKISSIQEAIDLVPTLVHNTVRFAEQCEKPLRNFISG